jgi:hypothetical protein
MKKAFAGFVVGVVSALCGTALAASSYVYFHDEPSDEVVITGARAAAYADMYIADGGWSGDRGDVVRCYTRRIRQDGPDEFRVRCKGNRTVASTDLPVGAKILEQIP